ncbi:hypothetical protein C8J57DRAFT_1726236 [Mycena rebaudengoi]|nr:hypothetical protein C8J57DRAFT_1726236 [Mycena rebaudengoi]
MGKNTSQKIAATTDWDAEQLQAMRLPFPDGLDPHFRHSTDLPDDFLSAYQRATVFIMKLGDNRVAYLWQQALKIGFRAGHVDAANPSSDPKASEDFALGREAGLKEGRAAGLRDGKQDGRKAGKLQGLKEGELIGFEKGKLEGMGEGKRVGFVAGREFGEKQALKASKSLVPERVLVDIGTDSPTIDIPPPPPAPSTPILPLPKPIDSPCAPAAAQNTPLSWGDLRLYAPGPENSSKASHPPRFNWADDAAEAVPTATATNTPSLPSRDLSVLRSAAGSLTPFGTLQSRARRTHRTTRPRHRSNFAPPTSTQPNASKPFRLTLSSNLDWDRDPRLSELGRVLRSMGWARWRGGVRDRDEDVAIFGGGQM